MTIGLRLVASLIDAKDGLAQYVRLRVDEPLFQNEAEHELYTFVAAHVTKYGKLPSRPTCKEAGFMLPGAQPEPPAFYADKCRERYVFLQLRDMLRTVEGDLNDDQPVQALGRMMEVMSTMQIFVHQDRIVDVADEAYKRVKTEYVAKRKATASGEDYGLPLGWPTLDGFTGGLMGGDLVTVVGRPGSGKTYLMLHAANHAWRAKKPPMFVSMEMKPLQIMQRQVAMLTTIPITGLKKAELTKPQLLRMRTQFDELVAASGVPYWVVDGALTATVTDTILMARQLQPGVVFIDGAYLLRTSNPKLSRWEQLTENATRIKSELAEALDVPVIISYQFNRQVRKGAKPGTAGLEDIAYTDAIGQLSSVVLGLMQEESVETLVRRKVEILKGRSGESGSFDINWIFDKGPDYMTFSELPKEKGPLIIK